MASDDGPLMKTRPRPTTKKSSGKGEKGELETAIAHKQLTEQRKDCKAEKEGIASPAFIVCLLWTGV